MLKNTISTATNNPVGLIAGAVAGYYVATKGFSSNKLWVIAAVAVVGGVVGANIQSGMKKKGAPTATTVIAPAK